MIKVCISEASNICKGNWKCSLNFAHFNLYFNILMCHFLCLNVKECFDKIIKMKSIACDIVIDCSVIYLGNHVDTIQQMYQFAIETSRKVLYI